MLGPALLVCPITEPIRFAPGSAPITDHPGTRQVYLPAGSDWYDFWTGRRHHGGSTIAADAALGIVPLFVRAGSILPLGPAVEHTGASAVGPLELRVYPGANGAFELYDDHGDGYGYDRGESVTTQLRWDDVAATLHLGSRLGSYPGMPPSVSASVVAVSPGIGVGHSIAVAGRQVHIGPQQSAIALRGGQQHGPPMADRTL
ncbi:MAG: DUF5110 domain-containing protein [Nakamurella sp.]